MILKVIYESLHPIRESFIQSFIGIDSESCWKQKDEFEAFLKAKNEDDVSNIYNIKVVCNPDFMEGGEE